MRHINIYWERGLCSLSTWRLTHISLCTIFSFWDTIHRRIWENYSPITPPYVRGLWKKARQLSQFVHLRSSMRCSKLWLARPVAAMFECNATWACSMSSPKQNEMYDHFMVGFVAPRMRFLLINNFLYFAVLMKYNQPIHYNVSHQKWVLTSRMPAIAKVALLAHVTRCYVQARDLGIKCLRVWSSILCSKQGKWLSGTITTKPHTCKWPIYKLIIPTFEYSLY